MECPLVALGAVDAVSSLPERILVRYVWAHRHFMSPIRSIPRRCAVHLALGGTAVVMSEGFLASAKGYMFRFVLESVDDIQSHRIVLASYIPGLSCLD